jgi:hypothetical protein
MSDFAEAVIGEHADELDVRFEGGARRILVCALVGIPIVGLRMIIGPGGDFVLVNEYLGNPTRGRRRSGWSHRRGRRT